MLTLLLYHLNNRRHPLKDAKMTINQKHNATKNPLTSGADQNETTYHLNTASPDNLLPINLVTASQDQNVQTQNSDVKAQLFGSNVQIPEAIG